MDERLAGERCDFAFDDGLGSYNGGVDARVDGGGSRGSGDSVVEVGLGEESLIVAVVDDRGRSGDESDWRGCG